MDKRKLIEALNSKAHEVTIEFLDPKGHEIGVKSMEFKEGLFVFQIVLDLPTEREIIHDTDSSDLMEMLVDREAVDTCCDCNIGWWTDDHTDCPLCGLKAVVEDDIDNLITAIKTLKGEIA